MTKVGRNAPCPCGSRKKYKRCCGRTSPNQPRATVSKSGGNTTTAEISPAGLPGQPQNIIVVPVFPDPADPRNAGGPQGKPGKYMVVFTLHRSGIQILEEDRYSFAGGLRGDSHLALPRPEVNTSGNRNATH